jgi:hypothetical protein
MSAKPATPEEQLLARLFVEMFQTEKSAVEHPPKEAARLGSGTPPGRALLATARHAERALAALTALAEREGFERRKFGMAIGKTFSVMRSLLADRLLSQEKSYRGTVLGLQHGLDCAALTAAVAHASGRNEVAKFFERWLEERRPLVAECQRQAAWFAQHSAFAMKKAG